MNAASERASGGFKRRALVFLAQLNRPISLGRLWLIMFVLQMIANVLAVLLRMIMAVFA